ncbi:MULTISPECIES: aspartate kinase [Caldilinea]|jgi:aspartokinase/homoserine dehydrogenase 1|uniref:Aspartokinase n=1 Tax=Caldilinea aerophila (strain DSM 14535 / JCM 11387 / NBRC 104270 / STL-6-O1) TaxID=926550 RepID=I0I1C3_CALAS|nr:MULTISPECIES: aspartate kinase [Caldilinea]MBO9392268.1 aspartate kinase [Caldilinea sp.]BAL99060.1 putative aspartokinase [Caldilinea aerophila DSM 14535 = NBRC 104270]GIV74349.1 MAG: aspartokinase [Caldilinea sp.]
MIVMKFGGTSVGSADAFAQVAQIVKAAVESESRRERPGVVVVTSAMSGVTNMLIEAAQRAERGDVSFYQAQQDSLLLKHQVVAGRLIEDGSERAALARVFEERLAEFDRLCSSIAVLGELTPRGLDVVSGLGERMAAPLLAAVLRAHGVRAEAIDATELIVTDNAFGSAAPITHLTEARCKERLLPLLEIGVVPVVTGFIGATAEGVPTTLGRGGSDYSASIIGAALGVDEIQIWTDVNGVMTADPRIVPNARSIRQLSYEEVAELAYYGAKVLHPKTVLPAIEKKIPVRVLNTFEPTHPGTLIVEKVQAEARGTVKAITAIRSMNLITIAGRGMMGVPGIAARTFSAVARVGANVLMISQSSSEQSICFVVPESSAEAVIAALHEEFRRELEHHYIDSIYGMPRINIIAVVGSGMRGTPGLAARVFTAVAQVGINVIAIAQGSSEANISLVVVDADVTSALRAIHDIFELHLPTEERMHKR